MCRYLNQAVECVMKFLKNKKMLLSALLVAAGIVWVVIVNSFFPTMAPLTMIGYFAAGCGVALMFGARSE